MALVRFTSEDNKEIAIAADALNSVQPKPLDDRYTVLHLGSGETITVRGRFEQVVSVLNQNGA